MQMLKKYFDMIKKNPKLLVIIGIGGIILIFLSTQFSSGSSSSKTKTTDSITAEEYTEQIEQKLEETVQNITGGEVNAVVTLETGIEYIYASEAKSDSNEEQNIEGTDKSVSKKDGSSEKTYVVITDGNGNEIPLVVTEIMPQIKGVVIVCNNGNNEQVKSLVESAVTTALNVSSRKVCVMGYYN